MVPRLSFAFFSLSALCGVTGMAWGSYMGASQDHSTLTAHAHLNLLGWVGLAIMGAFHALASGRVPSVLGWANFTLSALGALSLPLAMAVLTTVGDKSFVPLVIAGGMSTILGMVAFLISILAAWLRAERTLSPA